MCVQVGIPQTVVDFCRFQRYIIRKTMLRMHGEPILSDLFIIQEFHVELVSVGLFFRGLSTPFRVFSSHPDEWKLLE